MKSTAKASNRGSGSHAVFGNRDEVGLLNCLKHVGYTVRGYQLEGGRIIIHLQAGTSELCILTAVQGHVHCWVQMRSCTGGGTVESTAWCGGYNTQTITSIGVYINLSHPVQYTYAEGRPVQQRHTAKEYWQLPLCFISTRERTWLAGLVKSLDTERLKAASSVSIGPWPQLKGPEKVSGGRGRRRSVLRGSGMSVHLGAGLGPIGVLAKR